MSLDQSHTNSLQPTQSSKDFKPTGNEMYANMKERIWQHGYKQCYSSQNQHAHLSENAPTANKNSTYGKERVLPWNEFIHDSIEAVVQITARQMKVHQRFEEMYPAEARTVFNIAWFTIKSNNRLNIQN